MARISLFVLGLCVCASSIAGGFDTSVSTQSLQFGYQADSVRLLQGGADVEAGGFTNKTGNTGIYGKILAVGKQAGYKQPLQFGVGAKAYMADVNTNSNVGGVGIGGRVGYVIPSAVAPMGLILEGYVAPEIASFGEVKQINDVSGRIEVEVSGNSTVGYVGFRHMAAEMLNGETKEIDDNIHVGLKFRF